MTSSEVVHRTPTKTITTTSIVDHRVALNDGNEDTIRSNEDRGPVFPVDRGMKTSPPSCIVIGSVDGNLGDALSPILPLRQEGVDGELHQETSRNEEMHNMNEGNLMPAMIEKPHEVEKLEKDEEALEKSTLNENDGSVATGGKEASISDIDHCSPIISLEGDSNSSSERLGLNDSIASRGSLREEEIQRTREEVGASSLKFLETLRGAAFRRKADLARSSSNLAAKEREQRAVLASRGRTTTSQSDVTTDNVVRIDDKSKLVNHHFHARPLPATTGAIGQGGLSGVPKVEKKPTTIPSSPLLGARRQRRLVQNPSYDVRTTEFQDAKGGLFRARPLPKTTGRKGQAGQSGVPKVPKRPPTVPFSPLLGFRRPKPIREHESAEYSSVKSQTSAQSENPSQSGSSLNLLGLSIVGGKVSLSDDQETTPPVSNTTNAPIHDEGYKPRSTVRAQLRASFEAKRAENESHRRQEISKSRLDKVKALKRELKALRNSL